MTINNTIISINKKTPREVLLSVASRVKERRLELNMTQVELAKKAGLPLATYRKFEQKGVIAFSKLLQVAFALDALDDFDVLFSQRRYLSTEDVLNEGKKRERARHNG
jgi:transcriptional regulator with XRE-family HTH domain